MITLCVLFTGSGFERHIALNEFDRVLPGGEGQFFVGLDVADRSPVAGLGLFDRRRFIHHKADHEGCNGGGSV